MGRRPRRVRQTRRRQSVAVLAFLIGATPSFGEDVVSVWSEGARAFVSVRLKTLVAGAESIGEKEKFVIVTGATGGDEQGCEVVLRDVAGHDLGGFIQEDQGNSFFAFKDDRGRYLSCSEAGRVSARAKEIGEAQRFAVVPLREGAKVCIRAYKGWEGRLFVDHPAEFPTLKANVNTLQITPLLNKDFYSKELLTDLRRSFSTNGWETEYILRESPEIIRANPGESSLRGLLQRVVLMESLGYEVDYLIVYREPLVKGHAPGPWSDKRILAPSDVDAINAMFAQAHARREIRHHKYRLVALNYQFDTKPAGDTFCGHLTKGLDEKCRAFIKKNFWGLCVEINSHDYRSKREDIDTAMAAEWCRDNGLQLMITSGGATNKDTRYKKTYEDVFAEFGKRDVDPASPWLHYVLHHVFQPHGNRLPEWNKDSVAENAKWLIEQVQPKRTLSATKAAKRARPRSTPKPGASDEKAKRLLETAQNAEHMRHYGVAKSFYGMVISRYPDTPSAVEARNRIEALGGR